MSAEIEEVITYSWYCDECEEQGTDWDLERYAVREKNEHNKERHP